LTTIADSSAFRDQGRLLSQHQAALTLLQARLSAPQVLRLSWLDLACGRGQIIGSLDSNLSTEARAKIAFWAYDVDQRYARETHKLAERQGFASLKTDVGELSNFDRILPKEHLFDFITLTNTVHEIEPVSLATLLATCLGRLGETGTLFIYDMDRINPPELGALPWSRDEVRRIVQRMLDSLGASAYRPEVGLWKHQTCNGWNVQLERQHLGISRNDLTNATQKAILATRAEVVTLLRRKMAECRASLESLTACGATTAEEEQGDKERLLYEFWALSRALERSI
jgi:SAM-dependent methyltransferase